MKGLNKGKILNKFQRRVAKSRLLTKALVKLRNQANKIIGYHLAQSANHETNGEELLITLIKDRLQLVFDIGANTGEWSELLISKYRGNHPVIHLFEPGRVAHDILLRKFESDNDVIINNYGLSDLDGVQYFKENINDNRKSSFVQLPETSQGVPTIVKLISIDSYCKSEKIDKIDFLKIDCEGYDAKVILGAEECLRTGRIAALQFEYGQNWKAAGATLKQISLFLESFDYNLFFVTPQGLRSFVADEYGEFFEYANFLAIHNKNMTWVVKIIKK